MAVSIDTRAATFTNVVGTERQARLPVTSPPPAISASSGHLKAGTYRMIGVRTLASRRQHYTFAGAPVNYT